MPKATFYKHANYKGSSISLSDGQYEWNQLGALGNDQLSSIRVPPGMVVTIYEHEDRGGKTRTYHENVSRIDDTMNDRASTIVVETRSIMVYRHRGYSGALSHLSGDTAEIAHGNDEISSIYLGPGMSMTVFKHARFLGTSKTFTKSCQFVGTSWNDTISSFYIRGPGDKGVAILYQDKDYGGKATWFHYTEKMEEMFFLRNDESFISHRLQDQGTSSMRITPGLSVIASGGRYSETFKGNVPYVGDRLNDQISHILFDPHG